MKYGIKQGVTGVYMIQNRVNGKRYIGSSVNISGRLSNHMNRDSRKYDSEFYRDVIERGYTGFNFTVLEQCDREILVEREQFYYDELKPEYNQYRPEKCMFVHKGISKKANENSNTLEKVQQRKELYNTKEYSDLFRTMHTGRMRPVRIVEVNMNFISIRDCARWLNKNTDFKAKNKASKVKTVCDGERKRAFGFTYEYINESVETISKESTTVIDTQLEAVTR